MPIDVQCAACGKKLRAPDAQAGRVGKCPACKSDIVVPGNAVGAPGGVSPVRAGTPGSMPAMGSSPAVTSPSIARSAPVKSASPFASTMDDEFALPPPAVPMNGDRQPTNDLNVEPEEKHWYTIKAVLKLTELALLAEWIGASILGLGIIAIGLMAGGMSRGDVTTIQVITVLMMWGVVAMLLGWAALVTGWIVLMMSWPKDRRLLIGAASSAGVCVLIVLIVVSFGMLGFGSSAMRGPGAPSPLPNSTATTVIFSLASCVSLILFNFFLATVQQRIGRVHIDKQPYIYAGVVGALTLWCLICNLAITPTSRFVYWMVIVSNLGLLITELLWLWLINAFTSRDLRVSQAWKRL